MQYRRIAMILPTTLLVASGASFVIAQAPKSPTKVDFNRDIRPILSANCFSCHGQDSTARQAGLRLDNRDGAIASRNGRQAIDSAHPANSTLITRVNSTDANLVMPPASTGRKLTAQQRILLTNWVKQGAPYADHWSFSKLTKPVPPMVKAVSAVKTPLDNFVLAKLEMEGLKPSPMADRSTLIRRVSLDLTGLPPTLAETEDFLKDRSANAYEKVVDRLLASPHYGEHLARMWLDLARYADSQGYEKDQPRTIWRYRDWVINAFNADMPYDRFTIEQIAGDLLPQPKQSQILATAFHRNTMTNTEGGVDQEEFRSTAVKDRVDTTVQVWMGLTMGCAKCHSHKYDPLTIQDYYKFYALFNQTQDANYGDDSPKAEMPTDEQVWNRADLLEKRNKLQLAMAKGSPEIEVRQRTWEQKLPGSPWRSLRMLTGTTASGAVLKPRADSAIVASGVYKPRDTYTLTFDMPSENISAVRLEYLKDASLPNGGPGRNPSDQNIVTTEFKVEVQPASGGKAEKIGLTNPRADVEQGGFPIGNALLGKPETGWAYAPQNTMPHVAVFDLQKPVSLRGGKLIVTIRQDYQSYTAGCLRISYCASDPKGLRAELQSLGEVAAIPTDMRSTDQAKRLIEEFRKQDVELGPSYKAYAENEKAIAALDGQIARIPITHELPADKQRVTRIHQRGNFMDPGETVKGDVPPAFHPLPEGAPKNRLGAAQWIVSKQNPLTPRVAVNRIWARMFGEGIVETEEDFGTQGTAPTNPQLLDWLAATFRDDLNWSMKGLCKTIVMSATYQQSPTPSAEAAKRDPRNRLFSHGPRFRLSAEMVRDQALSIAGLLSPKIGGASVMPPQPDGIWHTVYSGAKWETSKGDDKYRRGLYTYWRRSSPYPAMTTFDAGSGEFCVVRRIRTNTPLQALVTLNDPAYVEAAGALGNAMLTAQLPDLKSRLIYGFRRATSRTPSDPEIKNLLKLYAETDERFKYHSADAKSLLKSANCSPINGHTSAEQADFTVIANVLLNLDEVLTKP